MFSTKNELAKPAFACTNLIDVPPKVLNDIIRQPFKKKRMVYGAC